MGKDMSAASWLAQALKESPAIPVRPIPCRFGCEASVGIFYVPEGCACYPDNHVMALCPQHAIGLEADGLSMISKWQ